MFFLSIVGSDYHVYYYVLLCITMYYNVSQCITMYCYTMYYYVSQCITVYYYGPRNKALQCFVSFRFLILSATSLPSTFQPKFLIDHETSLARFTFKTCFCFDRCLLLAAYTRRGRPRSRFYVSPAASSEMSRT